MMIEHEGKILDIMVEHERKVHWDLWKKDHAESSWHIPCKQSRREHRSGNLNNDSRHQLNKKNSRIIKVYLLIIFYEVKIVVSAKSNQPYIVRFELCRFHDFVPGDASPFLSLTPQKIYDKLTTSSTLNKVSYHSLTHRCGILQLYLLNKKTSNTKWKLFKAPLLRNT